MAFQRRHNHENIITMYSSRRKMAKEPHSVVLCAACFIAQKLDPSIELTVPIEIYRQSK